MYIFHEGLHVGSAHVMLVEATSYSQGVEVSPYKVEIYFHEHGCLNQFTLL